MKSNPKISARSKPLINQKTIYASSAITAIAIGKKLIEIKRTSGAGEMTELNMALFRHLK
jgi:hypothetical protein